MLWENVARRILFKLPAERAHHFSMGMFDRLLALAPISHTFASRYTVNDARLETNVFGLQFTNPVGLAAGFDKDAQWYPKLATLGLSLIHI